MKFFVCLEKTCVVPTNEEIGEVLHAKYAALLTPKDSKKELLSFEERLNYVVTLAEKAGILPSEDLVQEAYVGLLKEGLLHDVTETNMADVKRLSAITRINPSQAVVDTAVEASRQRPGFEFIEAHECIKKARTLKDTMHFVLSDACAARLALRAGCKGELMTELEDILGHEPVIPVDDAQKAINAYVLNCCEPDLEKTKNIFHVTGARPSITPEQVKVVYETHFAGLNRDTLSALWYLDRWFGEVKDYAEYDAAIQKGYLARIAYRHDPRYDDDLQRNFEIVRAMHDKTGMPLKLTPNQHYALLQSCLYYDLRHSDDGHTAKDLLKITEDKLSTQQIEAVYIKLLSARSTHEAKALEAITNIPITEAIRKKALTACVMKGNWGCADDLIAEGVAPSEDYYTSLINKLEK